MSTAICVITRAPTQGAKPKIAETLGAEFAAKLHGAMLRDTLDGLNAIEADRYVTTYRVEEGADVALSHHVHAPWELVPQPEGDFGAAMKHAAETFGSENALLLVRSDSPCALTETLEKALRDVDGGTFDVVLGPTEDGGYHFIATKSYVPELFAAIAWGTPGVCEATRAACRDRGLRLEELPVAYDVDSMQDMEKLVAELKMHPERAPRTAEFLVRNGW